MLDTKDKKIIYELDVDGFATNSVIAKKVGLSKQVVGYRIKQLEKKKIIRKIYGIYDLEKLGYSGHKVFFQMQNLDKESEQKIIKYFNSHKNIVWFGIYEGRFDFVISLFEKNKVSFDKTLSKIVSDLSDHIADFEITEYTGVLALKKKYLHNKKSTDKFSYFGGHSEKIKLDETDKEILKLLVNNPRSPSLKIAEKLKLSVDTVINRIRKLKKQEIIQGSRVMLNKNKLKISEFKILLKLKNYDEKTHEKLISFCKSNKFIVAYIKCVGPWNLELDVELPELSDFHEILMSIKTQFSDSIRSIETLLIHDEYKYDFFPFKIAK